MVVKILKKKLHEKVCANFLTGSVHIYEISGLHDAAFACLCSVAKLCQLLQSVIQKADTGKVDWREFSAFGGVSRQRD